MNNLAEKIFRVRPRWLDEEPTVLSLLDSFLHKLEKGHRLTMRVNSKTLPELFDPGSPDKQYLWSLLKTLNNEYHIFSIRYARNKPYQATYENAQLVFNPEKEELVREWLNRPALDPYALVWQDSLHKLKDQFEDHGQALAEQMIRLPDRGPEQTLRAFAKLNAELQKPVSLRTLSARCFWGDSKFLDQREGLIRQLFPSSSHNLLPRPVLLSVALSESIKRVLFVENLETYLSLAGAVPDTTLIYSAGFHAASPHIREPGKAVFSYLSSTPSSPDFERWWYGDAPELHTKTRFWGDLDFAGMSVLMALKGVFPELACWKTGYLPLLERLEQGSGHDQESSGKERQQDPGITGDEFADLELLPAMRDAGAFVDQEAVLISELEI